MIQIIWHYFKISVGTLGGIGGAGWIIEKISDYIVQSRKDKKDEKKQYMLEIIELLTIGESSNWQKNLLKRE